MESPFAPAYRGNPAYDQTLTATQPNFGIGGYSPGNTGSIAQAPQAPKNLQQDWANNPYWNTSKAGDVTAYGGGNLLRNADGSTTYSQQGQNPYTFSQSTDPATIAQNSQGIANEWSKTYGQGAWGQPSQNLGMGQPQQAAQPATASAPAGMGQNPWLQQQGAALQAQSNQNLRQNILPGIGQGAQAAGVYGSSRQGIAEGQAIGNAQTGLNSALANMYSQSYGQDQQYDLGLKSAANQAQANNNSYNLGIGNLALGNTQAKNSYDLGLRNNDLGFGQLDASINQNNFNNQLQGANFGLGIYDRMNGYNQQATNNGTQMQNTPLNYFNQFNNNTMAAAGTGGGNVVAQQGSVLGAGIGAGAATYGMLNKPYTYTQEF